MDVSAWILYALLAAAAIVAALLHYRRREPAGRGRTVLAALRGAALALLLLLLFDPALPAPAPDAGGTVALVDASLSMRLPGPGGATRWDEARQAVEDAGAERVLLFGAGAPAAVDTLPAAAPGAVESRLGPALRAALESGAGRVVVVSDAAIEDPAEAGRLTAGLGRRVELLRVGSATAGNVGLVEVEAPAWVEAGDEATVRIAVAGIGDDLPDTVGVSLRQGERVLARERVAVAPGGGLTSAALRFTPAEGSSEPLRLDVVLESNDAVPDDDRRSVYVRVAEQPAGVALVSFRPDQEPRFLMPVLERSSGLPVRGWMALPGGRYIRLGVGRDAGLVEDEGEARRAVDEAELVVLHGLGEATPAWARQAAAGAERALLFPAGDAAALPVQVGEPQPGDWYPAAEVPPSPVAPLLAGLEPGDVPPLAALRPADPPAGFWAPVTARLARRGEPRPVLVAGRADGRRVAVALGEGYWRWAFSGDAGRRLYDRMWSAVAAWLLEESGRTAVAGLRPESRVVERGRPVRWRVPASADSMRVVLRTGEGAAALDTVVAVLDAAAATPPLPPGHYRYEAAARSADGEGAGVDGELTVESFSPEFTRPAVAVELGAGRDGAAERDGVGGASGSAAIRAGRPLHTSPWPYVVLVLLVCTEWVLRRRWGLR